MGRERQGRISVRNNHCAEKRKKAPVTILCYYLRRPQSRKFFLLLLFIFVKIIFKLYVCVGMCTHDCRCLWSPEEALGPLELESQALSI